MSLLLIHPGYRDTLAKLKLQDIGSIERYFASQRVFREEPIVLICRGMLCPPGDEPVDTYYKQYRYAKLSWHFVGRWSKARFEYHNAMDMQRMGLPVAQPIACGEDRDRLGRLRSAFIITQAVPDSVPLDQFVAQRCADVTNLEHARLRRRIVEQLAPMVARLHLARFSHDDLHWRNVLVTLDDRGEPKLWWIDCPRGRRWAIPLLARRKFIKDLATLDITASETCTLRERLRMLRLYHRARKPLMSLRKLAKDVDDYRKRRWRKAKK